MADNETQVAEQTDAEFAADQKAKLDLALKAADAMRREEAALPAMLPGQQREEQARKAAFVARKRFEANQQYRSLTAAGMSHNEAMIRSGMDLFEPQSRGGAWHATHQAEPYTRSDFVTPPATKPITHVAGGVIYERDRYGNWQGKTPPPAKPHTYTVNTPKWSPADLQNHRALLAQDAAIATAIRKLDAAAPPDKTAKAVQSESLRQLHRQRLQVNRQREALEQQYGPPPSPPASAPTLEPPISSATTNAALPLTKNQSELVTGKSYKTARGIAVWNGEKFVKQ